MTDRLTRLLSQQLELQRALGTDPTLMDNDTRIMWLQHMTLAATDELHEALNETGWRAWAASKHINEKAAFGELRDALQFIINMMFTVHQVTPADLADLLENALDEKTKKNHARIQSNYAGTEKCPGCKRALDETPITQIHPELGDTSVIVYQCGECGHELTNDQVAALID